MRLRVIALFVGFTCVVACNSDSPSVPTDGGMPVSMMDSGPPIELSRMSLEQLQDPATCKTCHPKQYADWEGSMHAYASKDPVFVAMNQRGQRETDGGLGKFCVQCHAPMAVHNALTTDFVTRCFETDPAAKWAPG